MLCSKYDMICAFTHMRTQNFGRILHDGVIVGLQTLAGACARASIGACRRLQARAHVLAA